MKVVSNIIQRGLVVEFYKQNAAFFGLILLVFFGFIKSSEHIAIGSFLVNNPESLLFVYALWMAYAVKVVLFLLPAINRPENQFLANYFLLNPFTKYMVSWTSVLVLLIPVIMYGVFLMSLSAMQGHVLPIFSILACLFMLITILALLVNNQLNRLPHEKKIFQFRPFKKITIAPEFFFISFLIRNEIVLLILTKIYGALLIIGSSALYQTDDFDLRLLTTGVLLAAVGNVAILHKYVWFQYQPMAFSLNLPIAFFKIVVRQIITFFILLLPEFMVLLRHYPLEPGIYDVFGLLFFPVGLCYLMYGWMIWKNTTLSDFIIVVFWLIVLSTFFILFSVHPAILGIFTLVLSVIITYFRHYQYEHLE